MTDLIQLLSTLLILVSSLATAYAAYMARRSAKAAEKQIANEYERRRQDHIINLFSLQNELETRLFQCIPVRTDPLYNGINSPEDGKLLVGMYTDISSFVKQYNSHLEVFNSIYPQGLGKRNIELLHVELKKILGLFVDMSKDICDAKINVKGNYYADEFTKLSSECSNHLKSLLTPQSPQT